MIVTLYIDKIKLYVITLKLTIDLILKKYNVFLLQYHLKRLAVLHKYRDETKNAEVFIQDLHNLLLANSSAVNLKRIGSNFDGGYFIYDHLLKPDLLITAGIGKNCDFENSLAGLGTSVVALDPTITHLPRNHANFEWIKKYLSTKDDKKNMSLSTLMKLHSNPEKSIFLKIDIEGDEYKIIRDIPVNRDYLWQIIIEFHDLHKILNPTFRQSLKSCFEHLFQAYSIISINSNNFADVNIFGQSICPDVLEISFINNKFLQNRGVTDLQYISPKTCNNPSLPVTFGYPRFF